jgi:DNA-binding CsgD family transcriptional regulator
MSDRLTMAALRFAANIERLDDPTEILEMLHQVARVAGLNAGGAVRAPSWPRHGERKGFTEIYTHSSMPTEFWSELKALYAKHGHSFLAVLAWHNRGVFTLTEGLRIVKPTGSDRWIVELVHRYGARDALYVPDGKWMIIFWSSKITRLDAPTRAALQLAGLAASARLERLRSCRRDGESDPGLSARQRAVLRLVSYGHTLHGAADHLGIGYKTAAEHAERAGKKLGAKNLPHAVAEAMRRYVVLGVGMSAACAAIFDIYDICCWDEIVRWMV